MATHHIHPLTQDNTSSDGPILSRDPTPHSSVAIVPSVPARQTSPSIASELAEIQQRYSNMIAGGTRNRIATHKVIRTLQGVMDEAKHSLPGDVKLHLIAQTSSDIVTLVY